MKTLFKRLGTAASAFLLVSGLFFLAPTVAGAAGTATIDSITITPGTGAVAVGGITYVRSGGQFTVTVKTSNATCVDIGANGSPYSAAPKVPNGGGITTFTLTSPTPGGDGLRPVTANASSNSNGTKCTGNTAVMSAPLIHDNTGPVVTGTVTPTPTATGWNKSTATVTWAASDGGSGVASAPSPPTDTQSTRTAGTSFSRTVLDRVGNSTTTTVTVKLDDLRPTLTAIFPPIDGDNGWYKTKPVSLSFLCADVGGVQSGIKACPAAQSFNAEGPNSFTGTATDNADNVSSPLTASAKIDTVAPTVSGTATTSPNAAGWYKNDVTIHWTADDATSLVAAQPANTTISAEGTGLTSSTTAKDNAGNTGTGTSSPAVKIDKTPPITTATAPTGWNNTGVTFNLTATDGLLSGVAKTEYTIDGGATQTGTSPNVTGDGIHTVAFWSTDVAGNVEVSKSVQIKIDGTPPTITHSQSPDANANGWNNANVTVTFVCGDNLSGIASCTSPRTVSTEGASQAVTGTATDNAGNTATDPATVSIDKTKPTITAARSVAPNTNGWNNTSVSVSFTCGDALSGIASCSAPQTFNAEGANQSATGTATDNADNSASVTESPINIDKTAPTISGAFGPGWHNADVSVTWTCDDNLSGLDGLCPAPSTVSGEGADLGASVTITDKAGNPAIGSVTGVQIDRTAPVTTASVSAPTASGWYGPAGVLVTLNGIDSLSGIASTTYSVDGGAPQAYTVPFTITAGGSHTITFSSVDNAGNAEVAGPGITVKIDDQNPTITGSRAPGANGFGWNNGPVTVSFACDDAQSGVAFCSAPIQLGNEGLGQSVNGLAEDNVGNVASATVGDINIDLTAPTITGSPVTPANSAGWYNADVTIKWTGQDALSGIDPASVPANSVITGEGKDLQAGPASVSDQAGNVGSGKSAKVNIDRTVPTVSGATVNDDGTPRSANAAGWFNSAVRVRFSCTDALSGIDSCAGDVVLSTDGSAQSVTRGAVDLAGNTNTATVSGINLDATAPQSNDATIVCTGANGFCRGNKATVHLTANDNLSGVASITYSTNGNATKTVAGASADVDVPLNGSGKATVTFYATDVAGNVEKANAVDVKYDTLAPVVTHTLTPAANGYGWNKANVTVHFDAVDEDQGSGVDPATITPDQTVSTETPLAGVTINGSAADLAGNVGTDSVVVKLDKLAPTISGAATTAPNANGWYKSQVVIHFTCGDALSGVATCPGDDTLTADGANQSSVGTATDKAGNSASATVSGINIDTVAPSITITGNPPSVLGGANSLACTATDALSGMDGTCQIVISGGNANGVGTFTYYGTAKDKAGNVATTAPVTYRVKYNFSGFLQPINGAVGDPISIFKAGSTVPTKFQVRKADGTPVQAGALPGWLTPAKGSPTTLPIDETAFADPATSGNTYRWDATAQQYIFNYGTAKTQAGFFYRIGASLDDGTTYTIDVGFR